MGHNENICRPSLVSDLSRMLMLLLLMVALLLCGVL